MRAVAVLLITLCMVTSLASGSYNCYVTKRYSQTQTFFNDVYCNNIFVEDELEFTLLDKQYPTKVFTITHSNVPQLPPYFFKNFPNLESIFLYGIGVSKIHKDAFGNLNVVTDLGLHENQIREIPEYAFKTLSNLRFLNLSKNKLQKLFKKSLDGLVKLERLDLSNNFFDELRLDMLSSTPALRELVLANNTLSTIDSDCLNNLEYLQILNLHKNNLMYIPADLFRTNKNLKNLDLSNNNFKGLDINTIPKQLTILNVSNNIIDHETWNWFQSFEKLDISNTNLVDFRVGNATKYLYMSHNSINFLNETNFENSTNLIELDVSYNNIQEISKFVFQRSKLQFLDLSNNNLRGIPVGCFSNLSHLWNLDLSYNLLTDLEFGTFSGLNNLTVLYLNNNQLRSLPEKSFYVLKNLQLLNISNNLIDHLDITELIMQIPKLRSISLNENDWQCDNLFFIIHHLNNHRVGFTNGTKYTEENINGIACSDENDFKIPTSVKDPENITQSDYLEIINKFSNYFDKDFKNSSFYQFFQLLFSDTPLKTSFFKPPTFFKYSKQGSKNGKFFKHIKSESNESNGDDDDRDDKSKEQSPLISTTRESDSDENYYDIEPSALQDSNHQNSDFSSQILEFTNKVTLSVVVNVGILFAIIVFIIFVFVCKNRKRSVY